MPAGDFPTKHPEGLKSPNTGFRPIFRSFCRFYERLLYLNSCPGRLVVAKPHKISAGILSVMLYCGQRAEAPPSPFPCLVPSIHAKKKEPHQFHLRLPPQSPSVRHLAGFHRIRPSPLCRRQHPRPTARPRPPPRLRNPQKPPTAVTSPSPVFFRRHEDSAAKKAETSRPA